MRGFISNIKADKITWRGFILSIFFILLTLLFILANYTKLPPFIPVFNQLPWGTQRLTQTSGIFIPIAVFSFVFILNLIISSFVYPKNPLIARMIASTTLMVAVINFLFTIRTILLFL